MRFKDSNKQFVLCPYFSVKTNFLLPIHVFLAFCFLLHEAPSGETKSRRKKKKVVSLLKVTKYCMTCLFSALARLCEEV